MNFKKLAFWKKSYNSGSVAIMYDDRPSRANSYSSSDVGHKNAIVAACFRVSLAAITEAPMQVLDPKDEPVPNHPGGNLLSFPVRNIEGYSNVSGRRFWEMRLRSRYFDGNFYAIKLKNSNGAIIGLLPCPVGSVVPEVSPDGLYIERIRVSLGSNTSTFVPGEFIHLTSGQSRESMCLGEGLLATLLRYVRTDNDVTAFMGQLVNQPLLMHILTWGGLDLPTKEQGDMVRAHLASNRASGIAIGPPGTSATQIGTSPKEMALDAWTDLSEERICAVLGVPLSLAQLGAGMGTMTYSNVKELREHFTENTVVPWWLDDAEQVTASLMPDFERPTRNRFAFAQANIKSLQEDRDAFEKRARDNFLAGGVTLDEFRARIGSDPAPGVGPLYSWQLGVSATSSPDPTKAAEQAKFARELLAKIQTQRLTND